MGEGVMPGIQLHASVADSVISNRFIAIAPDRSRIFAVIVAAIAIGMAAAFLPFTLGAVMSLAIAAGWTWISVAAFRDGLWLELCLDPTTFSASEAAMIAKAWVDRFVS